MRNYDYLLNLFLPRKIFVIQIFARKKLFLYFNNQLPLKNGGRLKISFLFCKKRCKASPWLNSLAVELIYLAPSTD